MDHSRDRRPAAPCDHEWRGRQRRTLRDIVQYVDGDKQIEGRDALRQDHLEGFLRSFPDGSPRIEGYRLKKTLRMACGDMIGVEFASSFTDRRTGAFVNQKGGEFWRMKADRLIEWHIYATDWPRARARRSGTGAGV